VHVILRHTFLRAVTPTPFFSGKCLRIDPSPGHWWSGGIEVLCLSLGALLPRSDAFPATTRLLGNIVENLQQGEAGKEWDINNILMRFAMDMTSIVVRYSH